MPRIQCIFKNAPTQLDIMVPFNDAMTTGVLVKNASPVTLRRGKGHVSGPAHDAGVRFCPTLCKGFSLHQTKTFPSKTPARRCPSASWVNCSLHMELSDYLKITNCPARLYSCRPNIHLVSCLFPIPQDYRALPTQLSSSEEPPVPQNPSWRGPGAGPQCSLGGLHTGRGGVSGSHQGERVSQVKGHSIRRWPAPARWEGVGPTQEPRPSPALPSGKPPLQTSPEAIQLSPSLCVPGTVRAAAPMLEPEQASLSLSKSAWAF